MIDCLDQLRSRILSHPPGLDGTTAIPNLSLAILTERTIPTMTLCDPMMCLVVQGVKQVMIGGRVLRFQVGACFVSGIALPAMGAVLEADADLPYVAVALNLNMGTLARLVSETPNTASERDVREGYELAMAEPKLMEAIDSLLALLDTPEDISALAAGREREVLYRLLQGRHGDLLRQATHGGNAMANIRRSVDWIRSNLDQKLHIEEMAALARMSIPSFHRHFKAATSLSPIQYQKTLRLQAARRLIIANAEVGQAAFAVGYESASQFSREYSRLFGLPPSRDARQMKTIMSSAYVV